MCLFIFLIVVIIIILPATRIKKIRRQKEKYLQSIEQLNKKIVKLKERQNIIKDKNLLLQETEISGLEDLQQINQDLLGIIENSLPHTDNTKTRT